jgi:hypothetical protein
LREIFSFVLYMRTSSGTVGSMETQKDRREYLLAFNWVNKTVCVVQGHASWQSLQIAFYVGLAMPDGKLATGIGRYSGPDIASAASKSGLSLLS